MILEQSFPFVQYPESGDTDSDFYYRVTELDRKQSGPKFKKDAKAVEGDAFCGITRVGMLTPNSGRERAQPRCTRAIVSRPPAEGEN